MFYKSLLSFSVKNRNYNYNSKINSSVGLLLEIPCFVLSFGMLFAFDTMYPLYRIDLKQKRIKYNNSHPENFKQLIRGLRTETEYKYTLKCITDYEYLWVMAKDGEILSIEKEGKTLFLVWLDALRAKDCCADNWPGYIPTVLGLDIFKNEILPGLVDKGRFVAVNLSTETDGTIRTAEQFRADIGRYKKGRFITTK